MPLTASLARPLQSLTSPMSAHARSSASSTESTAPGVWAAIAHVCTSAGVLPAYVGAVIGGAFLILALRLPHVTFDQPLLFVALLGASALISASKVHLPLVSGSATLSMSYFTDFMSLVLLGPDQTMIVAGVGGVTQCLLSTRNRVPLRQVIFSVGALIISIQMAGLTAAWLGGFHLGQDLLTLSKPAVGAAAAFFLCNSWLVATAVALSRRESIHRLWQQNFMWTAPACFIGAGVAVLAIRVVMTMQIWVVLLAAAPLYLTYRSYRIYLGRVEDQERHLKQVSDLHLASVEALARAIDARDQTFDRTHGPNDNHIRRVQAAAAQLARGAGMSSDEVEGVKVAALLHDIGKLAVPEHILTKPGRLTPDEFERVRTHPQIGADIIRAVPFPYPVAPYIESHHERWDGSGYPEGLAGEAIPLGARVLAVVDYYDALITDRPYHRAMPEHAATELLQSECGRALDPRLVRLFIKMLPSINIRDSVERHEAETRERAQPHASGPANGFAPETQAAPRASMVFQNISRATQEMHALYDLAQTLGTRLSVEDTMGLLTSKLTRLVPVSCWALYLHDAATNTLTCRFASGLEAELVDGLQIPMGEGASGWAGRHRTPLVNARAEADFQAGGRTQASLPLRSTLAYPLVDGDTLVGTLTVYHADEGAFREEHRRLLDRVCNQVASVIRNSVLFEQMHQVSLTDSLTDLPNSRALFAYLAAQFAAVPAGAANTALLMFDLNGFKGINDKYGHQVGDLALRQVSAVIRENVRQGDFCARYAGDEFVVVLSDCGRAEADRRAMHIQRAVACLELEVRPGFAVTLTISGGVAVSPEDGTTYDDLLGAADRRMYQDKERTKRRDAQVAGTALPLAG
jgi:diguanylate cyclase (GGDEF)-like protein/putative nucleotidyltransferase with HDIG domain